MKEFVTGRFSDLEEFKWLLLFAPIVLAILTVAKLFIPHKAFVVKSFAASSVTMGLLALCFTLLPWVDAQIDQNNTALYCVGKCSSSPYLWLHLLGAYFIVVTCISTKGLFKLYDTYPKEVAKSIYPFFSKSWLERHYGKKDGKINSGSSVSEVVEDSNLK